MKNHSQHQQLPQGDLFAEPKPLVEVFSAPISNMKCVNPRAKRFFWDGEHFGVARPGSQKGEPMIVWLSYYRKRNTWLPIGQAGNKTYSTHLMDDCSAERFEMGVTKLQG